MLPLTLALAFPLVGPLAQDAPAQEPAFEEAEVEIETLDPAVRLAGTMTIPNGEGPFPALLLVTGSGGHLRDQVISGSPMFRQLAEGLSARGILVLRVDDRGVGKSSGPKVEQSTSRDRANDALASVRFLFDIPEVDPRRVGVFGHSEGGYLAPMVALDEPRVRFLALLAPPALPCGEIWIHQRVLAARGMGVSEPVLAAIEGPRRKLVEFAGRETFDEQRFLALARTFVAAHGIPEAEVTSEQIEGALGDLRTPWLRDFLGLDPSVALRKTRVPVFAAYGSLDEQVVASENLPVLARALAEAGNADVLLRVYPDHDHFFLRAPGLPPGQHKFGKMQLAPELVADLAGWILARK